jgi:hypothetical protein
MLPSSQTDLASCCRKHHDERHGLTGVFAGWTRDQLRRFIDGQIAIANGRYDTLQAIGGKVIPW